MNKYCAGDVVLVNFNNSIGHQQSGVRPALIVSNNVGNNYSPTVCVIPFTTKKKVKYQPTHAFYRASESSGLKYDSVLLAESITSVDKSQIHSYLGALTENELKRASVAMAAHVAPIFMKAYETGIQNEENFIKLAV